MTKLKHVVSCDLSSKLCSFFSTQVIFKKEKGIREPGGGNCLFIDANMREIKETGLFRFTMIMRVRRLKRIMCCSLCQCCCGVPGIKATLRHDVLGNKQF